jgi:hypothetical protein
MRSDRLLRDLGDLARKEAEAEQARLDERWDRLAAGTLTTEEETELKALAASSPEAREAYEAFKPLGAEFQARVMSAINAQRESEKRQREPTFWPVVRRMEFWFGAAAAMAAGVFFLVLRPAPMLTSGYQADLEGGFKTTRGVEAAPPEGKQVFTPGSPFNLEVNPKQPLEHHGEVKARAYLSHSAGWEDLRPLGLEDKFEPGETGSVRLAATMGEDDLKVPPGDWIFWAVVARKSLPEAKEVQARLRANRPRNDSWQDICDALKQEENPPPAPWQVACVGFRTEGQPDP